MAIVVRPDTIKWFDTIISFLESEHCPPTYGIPVIIYDNSDYSNKFILFNSEQLTRKQMLDHVIELSKHSNCVEVWDYSKMNVDILASHGITAKHYPLICSTSYLSTLQGFREQPIQYDIGFCGGFSQRREDILYSLEEKGYHILVLYNEFGIERDRLLAQCKLLINIHYADDYQIFESSRCEPWLAIGVPIISEHSLDNDPRCTNVSYCELVDKTIELLTNLNDQEQ
jgi:hypothetical protein